MPLDFWLILGFTAQTMFFLRFFVQWVASEKKKKSVIPIHFWYLSIIGASGLLIYSIHLKDPVFIAGYSFGFFVYFRNLILIFRKKKKVLN